MNVLDVVKLEGVGLIYFKPNIPEALKQNALMKICPGLSPDDEILILLDESILGDGKAGIVMTNRRIYFRENWNTAIYYEFKDAEYFSATKLKGFLKAQATLFVNGQETYNFTTLNLNTANFFCSELNKYIKQLYLEQHKANTAASIAASVGAASLMGENIAETAEKSGIVKAVNEYIEDKAIDKATNIVINEIKAHSETPQGISDESDTSDIDDDISDDD